MAENDNKAESDGGPTGAEEVKQEATKVGEQAGDALKLKAEKMVESPLEAGADALAIVTEWNEFREPNFTRMRDLLRTPVIFDGRNLYSPEHVGGLGFTYFSIGR